MARKWAFQHYYKRIALDAHITPISQGESTLNFAGNWWKFSFQNEIVIYATKLGVDSTKNFLWALLQVVLQYYAK